jgi:hypothetical protein
MMRRRCTASAAASASDRSSCMPADPGMPAGAVIAGITWGKRKVPRSAYPRCRGAENVWRRRSPPASWHRRVHGHDAASRSASA